MLGTFMVTLQAFQYIADRDPGPVRVLAGLSSLRSGLHRQVPPSVERRALAGLEAAGLCYTLGNPFRR